MTNSEKYKTAQERAEAFDKFCKSNTTDGGMCMPDCKLFYAQVDEKSVCGHCEFHWLDIEAEEEKPLPCPFCGGRCSVNGGGKAFQIACKALCGYVSAVAYTESEAIAAHNRVAKDVQNQDKYCEFCRPEMSTLHCTARYISESAKKHIEKIERILNGFCDTSHAIAVIGEAKCIIESFRNDERKYRD